METPQKEKSNKQICQIRIMFPVDSDEQAIEHKKQITAVLSEIPDAQIQFSLSNFPTNGTPIR